MDEVSEREIIFDNHIFLKNIFSLISKESDEHLETMDKNDIRDYADGFLIEQKAREKDPKNSFTSNYNF